MIGANSATPSRPTASDEPGELVGLEGDRDEGRHRAELGDGLAQDEQAEVAPAAQEAEVDGDRSERPAATPTRSRACPGTGAVNGAQATSSPGRSHLGWRDGRVARRDGAVAVSVQP